VGNRSPSDIIPRTYFGMHFHRADRGTKWPGPEIGAWRIWDANVLWVDVEPQPGTWDFSRLDRYVSMAQSANVELNYLLGFSPPWASARPEEKGVYSKNKKGDVAEPARLEDWENFVRTVVKRYKGRISSYEVWNEVNTGTGFYSGTPEALLALQKAAYKIVKQEDPSALLVLPSVTGEMDRDFEWFDKYLGLGAGKYVDVIGYHMYQPRKAPEELLGLVQKLRAVMARHGIADKPLWNSESGYRMDFGQKKLQVADSTSWPALSPERAEAYVVRALVLGWWAGLDRFYWYAWDNYDLGLMDKSGNVMPAGKAYLTTARWLTGASLKSCKRAAPVWVCAVARKGRNGWLAWNETNAEISWPTDSLPAKAWQTLSGEIGTIDQTKKVKLDGRPLLLLDSNVAWPEK